MIPAAWCGSIDQLSGHRRSKFLFRRVEARVACNALFALDALHILEEAEGLRSAYYENYEQDREKLILRLSTRQKKERRESKELSLSNFALKGKPKMGFDLLQTLKELLKMMTT